MGAAAKCDPHHPQEPHADVMPQQGEFNRCQDILCMAGLRGGPAKQLPGALKRYWNKSESRVFYQHFL
jgi:hypothetical protein